MNILIIRSGAVGDFVLTTPVVATLKSAYPESMLSFAGNPDRLALAAHLVDHALDLNDAGWASVFGPEPCLPSRIRDVISASDLIVSFLPDADGVLGRNLRNLCAGTVITHTPHPSEDPPVHIVDHLLQALAPLRIDALRQPSVSTADPRLEDLPEAPYAVIHPGSGGQYKVWPADRFAAVASDLSNRLSVIVTAGPADEAIVSNLRSHLPDAHVVERISLPALAGLYAEADLFIGNDSGPTHLAAATGTPTLALFGPTRPAVWGPIGPHVKIVAEESDIPQTSRLKSISVEQVVKAANQLISQGI